MEEERGYDEEAIMTQRAISRRSFLAKSAAGTAVAALAQAPALGRRNASEMLNVGCIGTGGRCRTLMQSLAKVPNVRLAAVCDVYEVNLELGAKLADPKAFITKNHADVLNRKDIDAVLIGTPDHWHVPLTVAACSAGKDVYVEKPLTHNLEEGRAVIDAQNRHHRIVQVGTQQRSMPQFQKGCEIVRSGGIGKIHKVHLTWNRNMDRPRRDAQKIEESKVDWKAFLGAAPHQSFDPYRFRAWRWFWDFGNGILTDLMVHFIEVVHWYFELEHPLRATTIGSNIISKGLWETPDTIQTLLLYPNDLQVYFEGTFVNARNGAMLEFMGSDGTLYLDRGRYEVIPERGKRKAEEWVLGKGKRGQDFYDKPDGELLHLTNWVECIRSRKRPNAPAEAGVSAASAAHLGNIAYRSGQIAEWTE
jgi:predicted dehydrogenase